ncbi:MAG: N-acetylmuramic acid 6-phosphate etherase [Phycisphaera sp.]|nr:N-acetylmuramic acid 6-phosphate etherase [Phycisphaera sp.]
MTSSNHQSSNINHQLPPFPPNRGHLLTEKHLHASAGLDAMSVRDVLTTINDQDALVAAVVRRAIPEIEKLVEHIASQMEHGGRLVYFGAGTSGRLGVLDASECPPTFCVDPGEVVGIIAGGDGALRKSSEGAEDNPDGVDPEWGRLKIGEQDTAVGIAAGGTTPYVLGGLRLAKLRGATTALVTCVEGVEKTLADHVIALPVGPEVLTGSTRMKAGTATKMALNMLTTAVMVRRGKAWGNLMVDLRASNAKLIDRALRMLQTQCGLDRPSAGRLLEQAHGHVKLAIVMHKRGVDASQAQKLLEEHGQRLREVVGPPVAGV